MNTSWVIYGLKDPESSEIRYIGRTNNLAKRIREHLRGDTEAQIRNVAKNRWIEDLASRSLKPMVEVLERGSGADECFEAEVRWIAHFRAISGRALLNILPGGRAGARRGEYKVSDSTRAKLAEAARAAWQRGVRPRPQVSDSTRAKLAEAARAWQRGVRPRPEKKTKRIRRPATPETRIKLSEALRRRYASAEAREKTAAALRGRKKKPMSIETREKLSAAMRGRRTKKEQH